MKKLFVLLAVAIGFSSLAQLPDGSIAPDFTLKDLNGNSHTLYSYLDANKTVYVEIFAAHCSSCWNYHQSGKLKTLYNSYGPNGTDEIMVLALEYDQWNDSNAFIGIGDPWVTQGNWLAGTPYPIFNVEAPNRSVFTDYNVTGYPVIYKICSDKTTERIFTSASVAQMYSKAQACQSVSSIEEDELSWSIYFNQQSQRVFIEGSESIQSVSIMNVRCQVVKTSTSNTQSGILVDDLSSGVYLFEIRSVSGSSFQRLYIN